MTPEVVIVGAARTPFSRYGGLARDLPNTDLGAAAMRAALERSGISPQVVDEVYYGNCMLAESALQTNVNARQALLKAGLPDETVSMAIDRACCSGLAAVQLGARAIRAGDARVVLAGGSDNMSRTPYLVRDARWSGGRVGKPVLEDPLFELGYRDFNPVSVDAGEVALEYGVDREAQDRWAVRSQERYAAAKAAGYFDDELTPLMVPQPRGQTATLAEDEFPKPNTTYEGLAKLATVYGSPTVTAGNGPGLDAGAAMLVLADRAYAEEVQAPILGTIVDTASVASDPRCMATVPGLAIRKVLRRAGLTLDDLDLIEINEAFAAVPLVSLALLADGDARCLAALKERTNVNGGAVAIGHPIGASGARILMALTFELRRRGGGCGAAAICGGLAQGDAVIVRAEPPRRSTTEVR